MLCIYQPRIATIVNRSATTVVELGNDILSIFNVTDYDMIFSSQNLTELENTIEETQTFAEDLRNEVDGISLNKFSEDFGDESTLSQRPLAETVRSARAESRLPQLACQMILCHPAPKHHKTASPPTYSPAHCNRPIVTNYDEQRSNYMRIVLGVLMAFVLFFGKRCPPCLTEPVPSYTMFVMNVPFFSRCR
jgi:hypothetical protein